MIFLLAGLVTAVIVMILSGELAPRRELDAIKTVRELALRSVDYDLAYGVRTHAEVLERLPQWMVADFDCPDRGPHDFVAVTSHDTTHEWCKHCTRKRITRCPDDTRDPLEVIYALQFGR